MYLVILVITLQIKIDAVKLNRCIVNSAKNNQRKNVPEITQETKWKY